MAIYITRLFASVSGMHTPAVRHDTARLLWLDDRRHSYFIGALVWVVVILMIVPEGFAYGITARSGSSLTRLLWLSVLGSSLTVLVWRAKLVWLVLRSVNHYLLAFLALAALSIAWSIDPGSTGKRLLRLFEIVAVATAFVCVGWHRCRYQNVVRPVVTLMLAGSILFGLTYPELAIHQSSSSELRNAWHGLATQKNGFGALAGIGVVFWFHAWLTREVRRLWALAGGALAVVCLLLSRSSTSMLAAAFVVVLLLLLLRTSPGLRRYMPVIVVSFIAFLLIYSLAILRLVPGSDIILSPISMVTGKDLTFSNRAEIWAIVTEHVQLSPWLGTGYGGYWTGDLSSPSIVFMTRMYFYPNSAHNGYLDMVNDLGAVGLLLLIAYLIVYVRQALSLFAVDREQGALYLALFLQQAITNLSETRWLSAVCFDFVIMTLATFALARAHLEYALRYYYGEPRLQPAPTAGLVRLAVAVPAGVARQVQ